MNANGAEVTSEPDRDQDGEAESADSCPEPEQAWKALALVNEWIRHAETKGGAVLGAAGVAGGVLYNLVSSQQRSSCVLSVLTLICGVFVCAAGFCATAALIPRRKVSAGSENFSNLLFYSHVALVYRDDEPSYAEVLAALTSNGQELTRHIANQVHANSVVADRKYIWASRAIVGLVAALGLLGIIALVIGLQNLNGR